MKDIFDKIDQQAKTWKYRKSAELTAKMIRYNNQHSDKVIDADNIAELTGLSENVVKQILAGTWKNKREYQMVEKIFIQRKENNMNTKLLDKMKELLAETLSLKLPDKNGKLVSVYYLKQRFVDEPLFSKSVDEQVKLLFPEERRVTVTATLVGHAELQMWVNAAFTKDNKPYQISNPFWHVQDGSYFFDNFGAFDDTDVDYLNSDFVKNTEINKLRIKINEYNEKLELHNKALDPVSNYDIIWSSSLNHGRLNMYQIDQIFRKLYDLNNHRYYMVFTDYATWHFEDFPYVKLSNQPNDRSLLEDYEFNFESYDQDNELELRKIGINRQTHQMEFFYALKSKREIIAHMYFKQYA